MSASTPLPERSTSNFLDGPGAFYQPTILTGIRRDNPAYFEEFFGPVAQVHVVRDDDEAVELANDSHFGLSGAIFTNDVDRARRLASRLETGSVWIHTRSSTSPELPFGGVKRSGYGRELSEYGIKEFVNRKWSSWPTPDADPPYKENSMSEISKRGIEGKVVLITGGGTGLGAETARYLAARGAKIAVAGRRKDKLEEVVGQIDSAGGQARAYQLDVARKDEFKQVVDAVVADFGKLDVLINNAGLMPIRPMAEVNTDEWDAMIDINLKGVLYGIAATLPLFLGRGSGHVINISSVAGTKVFSPGGTVYSGTKFVVSAISEGLRHEVGYKMRVTSIAPGAVESDLKFSTSGTSQAAVMDFYKAAIPAVTIARAIAYAIEQPDDVDINEIVLRPTAQEF